MQFSVTDDNAGDRIDKFLASTLNVARNQVQAAIKDKQVTLNGKPTKSSQRLEPEDQIEVLTEIAESREIPPLKPRPDIKLNIVHEDDDLVVLNKAFGMLMHPAVATDDDTLAHALLAAYPDIASVGESPDRPGIMQRLDRDASGLVVIAKNQASFNRLKQQFHDHATLKEYACLVQGKMAKEEGKIDLVIGRHGGGGRMAARPESQAGEKDRPAVTHYMVDEQFDKAALLTVRTETGRTHQIRVHLKAIGNPLVGDDLYGKKGKKGEITSPRLFLHAKKLGFRHPTTDEWVEFDSPLPKDLQTVLDRLQG